MNTTLNVNTPPKSNIKTPNQGQVKANLTNQNSTKTDKTIATNSPTNIQRHDSKPIKDLGKIKVLVIDNYTDPHGSFVEHLLANKINKDKIEVYGEDFASYSYEYISNKIDNGQIPQPDIINLSSHLLMKVKKSEETATIDNIPSVIEDQISGTDGKRLAKDFTKVLENKDIERAFYKMPLPDKIEIRDTLYNSLVIRKNDKEALRKMIQNAHVTVYAAGNNRHEVNLGSLIFLTDKQLEESPEQRINNLKNPKSKGNIIAAASTQADGTKSTYSSTINTAGTHPAQGAYNIYQEVDGSGSQYILQGKEKMYLPPEYWIEADQINIIKKFNGKSIPQKRSQKDILSDLQNFAPLGNKTPGRFHRDVLYKTVDVQRGIESYEKTKGLSIAMLNRLDLLYEQLKDSKDQGEYSVKGNKGLIYFKEKNGKLVYNPAIEKLKNGSDLVIGRTDGTSWATPNVAANQANQFTDNKLKALQEYIKNFRGEPKDVIPSGKKLNTVG